jgi:hypothetical protein
MKRCDIPDNPPAAIAEAAATKDLGQQVAVYRDRQLWTPVGSWLTGLAVVASLILAIAGAGVVSTVIVPLIVLGVIGYRYWQLHFWAHRWLAEYEHGYVEVVVDNDNAAQQVQWQRAARWDEQPDGVGTGAEWRARRTRPNRPPLLAAALAAAVVIPIAGYAASPSRPASPVSAASPSAASPGPPSPTRTAPPTLPARLSGFTCYPKDGEYTGGLGPGLFPAAAPYSGPGPHPTVYFSMGQSSINKPAEPPVVFGTGNGSTSGENVDLAAIQLVACSYYSEAATAAAGNQTATTCVYSSLPGYHGDPARMVWAYYRIDVFEARTSRFVETLTVRAEDKTCPPSINAPIGGPLPELKTQFNADQASKALRKYWQ